MRRFHVSGMIALAHVKGLAFECCFAPINFTTIKLKHFLWGKFSAWRIRLSKGNVEVCPD